MKKLLLLLFMSVSLVMSAQSQPEVKELTIQGSRPIYGMLASPRVEKPAGIVIISHGLMAPMTMKWISLSHWRPLDTMCMPSTSPVDRS